MSTTTTGATVIDRRRMIYHGDGARRHPADVAQLCAECAPPACYCPGDCGCRDSAAGRPRLNMCGCRCDGRGARTDVRWLTLPYSEVCVHMRLAGLTLPCTLTDSGRGVQVWSESGWPCGGPITRGEAGWDRG